MMQSIMLLGSSGSIGKSALSVIDNHREFFSVDSLAVNTNEELLETQIREFKPKRVFINQSRDKNKIKNRFPSVRIFFGREELESFIEESEADIVISSISGFAGLMPTYYAIKHNKKKIALANKESLVCAGRILIESARKKGISIIPVDSEHSTLFKLLSGHRASDIAGLALTASGGPFLRYSRDKLAEVSISDALDHPRWKMGKKISIDSATMVNKILEVIEAHYFFDMPYDRIKIVIHPQSIVHSLIRTKSNTYIAELGPTDMRIPIANALFYPDDFYNQFIGFDLAGIEALTFEKPSAERFPILKYPEIVDMGKQQIYHIALNSSNEEAVYAFLNGEIPFPAIERIIFDTLDTITENDPDSIEDVVSYDALYRQRAREIIKRTKK